MGDRCTAGQHHSIFPFGVIARRAGSISLRSVQHRPVGLGAIARAPYVARRFPRECLARKSWGRARYAARRSIERKERKMKSRTSTCIVAVFLAVIEPGLAQSPEERPTATLPLKGLLSLPLHPGGTA